MCPGGWVAGGHRPRDGPSPLARLPGDRPWDVTLLLSLLVAWRKFLLPENPDVVTLDPNTAHSQLVLSADRRRVRRQSEERDLPDIPERFSYYCCVLGQERFREGRHCWEVEVEGEVGGDSWWAVGVAKESVQRKGRPFLIPEAGIWAVRHSYGQFASLTSRRTLLPQSPLPSRIWVCLDCARGLVTFLHADTGVEIFTFPPASFKGETLRPWFLVGTEKTQLCLRGSAPQTLIPPSLPSPAAGSPCPSPETPRAPLLDPTGDVHPCAPARGAEGE
ncbi:butyrophilin subfamily 2 member A2-like isoform X3 [Larus michahellis]|uniref:butyrophilin subfamily 2 member A2-like isoform X3 n=1 Tax=Larus michahellis TaxID=119627 RepID=UPI003D9B6945